MTTKAQLRKAALALPEVTEGTHFGMPAFAVRDKGFAALDKDGYVQLRLPDDETEAAIAAHTTAERLVRMGTPIGLRAPLTDLNGKDLNALVLAAWRHRAPKRLAATIERTTTPGDLPASIGKPATRALVTAQVTTLDQVAAWTEAELLALHGVGPRAVRILAESLAQQGKSFR